MSTGATTTVTNQTRAGWPLAYGLAIVAILALLAFFPSEKKALSRPLIRVAHPAAGASLIVTMADNSIENAQATQLHIEAIADDRTRIEGLQVCASSADFSVKDCVPVPLRKGRDVHLPPPSTLILTPLRDSGNASVLVTATWSRFVPKISKQRPKDKDSKADDKSCVALSSECTSVAEEMVMTVGPIRLGVDKWARFANRLSRFLKDLTLPVILIFLANWLTRKASERDRRREEAETNAREQRDRKEKEDEKARHALEKEQEEQKQIAHLLLPKVMTLSGQYYLPLASNLRQFLRLLDMKPIDAREAAFYLLSFFYVARALKEKEGGIFFKDMAAERIFTIANNVIRDSLVRVVSGEKEYTLLLDTFDTFLPQGAERWPRYAELLDVPPPPWQAVEHWLVSIGSDDLHCVGYLFTVLLATLRFESNAPYVHWYSNSKAENLFKIPKGLAAPNGNVLGGRFSSEIDEFNGLLAVYRQGKEK